MFSAKKEKPQKPKSALFKKVEKVLKEVQGPIQAHGGDLALVKVEKGKVVIKILGACIGCSMAEITFGSQMEEMIKKKVPEVKKVEFLA